MENPYAQSEVYQSPLSLPTQGIKHSILGISSFILSIVTIIGCIATIGIAGYLELSTPGGIEENDTVTMSIGLSIIFFAFCGIVSLGLGIVGLFQRNTKKVFSILGITFSIGLGLSVIGLMFLGLADS